MNDHVRCPHGLLRRGHCYDCQRVVERHERVAAWLHHRDRYITAVIGLPTLLALLYVAGQGAIYVVGR